MYPPTPSGCISATFGFFAEAAVPTLLPYTQQDALKDGKVFNAVDACTHLGMDGIGMDKAWAIAKGDGKLVKFGGTVHLPHGGQPAKNPGPNCTPPLRTPNSTGTW